jgi:hypothetical protein
MKDNSYRALAQRSLFLALLGAIVTCNEPGGPAVPPPSATPVAALQVSGVTQTLLTSGSATPNQKVYTTASIAPAPNALITVAVLGHNSSSAPPAPTLSGGGMTTWTEVASVTFDNTGSELDRLTVFRAMSATPGTGPLTITFAKTVSNSQWMVSQWDGVDGSGTNGSGAIGQTGSTAGDGVGGLTVGLGAFTDPGNVAYGVFGVASKMAVVSPGNGFAEIGEQPSGESTPADLEAEWAANVPTVEASWSGENGGAIGIEIKSGQSGGGTGGGGTGTVSGTVTTTQGAGLSGVIVEVNPGGQSAVTGSDGTYSFANVPVGATTVTVTGFPAQCGQPQPSSEQVDVTDGGTATANFTLDCSSPPPPRPTGAITHTLLTAGSATPNQRVYTTASFTPAPNTLITVAVLGHNSSSAPPAPTVSGGGMTTWTEVTSVTFDNTGSPLDRLTVFRAMSAMPGSGPLTITFAKTVSDCQWIVSQWSGVDQSGTNGSGAIGQMGSTTGDGVSGLTVDLGVFSDPGSVAYGVFGVASKTADVTPGNGFEEISEQPSGESTPADLEAQWATGTGAVSGAWAPTNAASVGIEIKAIALGTGSISGTVTNSLWGGSSFVTVEATPNGKTGLTGSDGSYTITGVPVGVSTVAITGYPAACSNPEPSSTVVTVTAGGLSVVDFTISCLYDLVVNPYSLVLAVGDSDLLGILSAYGPPPLPSVTWSSSDASVLGVNPQAVNGASAAVMVLAVTEGDATVNGDAANAVPTWGTVHVVAPSTEVSAPLQISPPDQSVFTSSPRELSLSWNAVQGAVQYEVEIQACDVWSSPWWTSCESWSRVDVTSETSNTYLVAGFIGAQPGRWRVRAIDSNGGVSGFSQWLNFLWSQ